MTAVECGNFTAAARLLKITQPAVTQNIADLENELGAKLLERSRSGISLTEKGELFYVYARQILHWYKVASDAFRPHPLDIHPEPVTPQRLKLDDGNEALVWTSGGDIHIELIKK